MQVKSRATRRALAAAVLTTLLTAGAAQAATAGSVYLMTNQAGGNAVMVYDRADDGTLTLTATVPTGGLGAGTGGDPLGSQGALVYAHGLLLAVNAGSNDVSLFRADGAGLTLLDRQPSGGTTPVSVAVHGALAYVVNAGGTPNISGFIVDPFARRLLPLPHSQRALPGGSAAAPAEVNFSADGESLLVTEKGTKTIDTFELGFLGLAGQGVSHASSGMVPFGLNDTRRGYALVVEAGSGSASSYAIGDDGALTPVTASLPLGGQKAPCWIATTSDGRMAFTANAGSGSISSVAVAADGSLTLVNATAASLTAPLDMALTADNRFLYARDGNGAVTGFRVGPDGSLVEVATESGIPAGAQGIAVR